MHRFLNSCGSFLANDLELADPTGHLTEDNDSLGQSRAGKMSPSGPVTKDKQRKTAFFKKVCLELKTIRQTVSKTD